MMYSITTLVLPLALLAITHAAAPRQDSRPLSGSSPRHTPLGLLLRKRSLQSFLRAPPTSSFFSESMVHAPKKRDDQDEYWIWMPAHGYMPIPRDEIEDEDESSSSSSTILRYG